MRKGKLFLTCVAFCLTVLAFSLITGWPSSLSHAALLATVGWLISVGLLDPELKTRSIPAVGALCALVLLSGFWAWQKPWEQKGKAWVNYDAAFFYLDNSPVDNVSIELPLPVKGENLLFTTINWGLCWQNPHGNIFREIGGYENILSTFWGLRGTRKENVAVLDWEREDALVRYTLDRLYPREVFIISMSQYVWRSELGKVTAKVRGENPRASFSSPRPIRARFWVEITERVGERLKLIEAFLCENEGTGGALELLPTDNTFYQFFVSI